MDGKLKKEWVNNWNEEQLINNAVSMGMEYMAEKISTEDLKHNKKMLVNRLKKLTAEPNR